jgi:hypothetical protein
MSHPAAQAYLDDFVRHLGSQGLRFFKVDFIYSGMPSATAEIVGWALAVRRSGFPIKLSLSPGNSNAQDLQTVAKQPEIVMARSTPDLWDDWSFVQERLAIVGPLLPLTPTGSGSLTWPDHDMLPWSRIGANVSAPQPIVPPFTPCSDAQLHCGHWNISNPLCCPRESRLSPTEQNSVFSLWCLWRAPLFIGGNLPDLSEADIAVLTNPELLAVSDWGRNPMEVDASFLRQGLLAYASTDSSGSAQNNPRFLAVVNNGESPLQPVSIKLRDLGFPASTSAVTARDLFSRQDGPTQMAGSVTVPPLQPHASIIWRLMPTA